MTMCGRFALFSDINVIKNYAQLFDNNLNWSAHYNIAPSLEIPVIINSHGKRYLTMLKWGFVPDFASQHNQCKGRDLSDKTFI